MGGREGAGARRRGEVLRTSKGWRIETAENRAALPAARFAANEREGSCLEDLAFWAGCSWAAMCWWAGKSKE